MRRQKHMARATALAGALAEVSVATVLAIFEMEHRSGIIWLWDRERAGEIALRAGQVVRATLDTQPPLQGREALFAMLAWREGRFSFRSVEVEGPDEVNLSTTHLLLEAARRADETTAWCADAS